MLRDDEEDGGRPPLYRGGLIHHPRPATTQHMLMQSHLHDVSTIDLMIALPYALSPALPHEEAWSRCRHAALNRIFNPIMATHMSCRGVGAIRSRLEQLIVQARHTLRETQSASRLCAFDLLAARVDAPGGVQGDASAQRSRCMNHDTATTSHVRGILKATSQTDDIQQQQQQQHHDGDDLSLAQKLLYVVLRTSAVDHRDDAIRQPSSSSSSSSSATAFTATNKERLNDANEGAAKHWCIEPLANASWPSTSSSLQKTSSPTTTTTSFSMMMKPSTCWLSPSMIFILERSGEMRDALRWSTDPDLIVLSVLTQSSSPHNNISSAWMMDNHGSAPSITSATTSEWGSAESSDVVRLVGDAPRRRRASSTSMKRLASTTRVAVDPTPANNNNNNNNNTSSNHTDIRKRPHAALFSMMSSVYSSDVCGILFVALHRCVVGVADPYQLTEVVERNTSSPTSCEVFMTVAASFLGSPNDADDDDDDDDAPTMHARVVALQGKISADVPRKRRKRDAANPPTPSKTTTTTSMNAASSPNNEDRRLRHRACTRGVMAMLQWGCSCGTLFLRLQHLCVLAEQPHQRVGLGVYGVCAVAALRTCLAVLRRQAVELSVRPGGPHGIRFSELIDAYQRLEHVEEGVLVLANYFHVRASGDYDARDAIRRLSSATLLSEGFSHFSARCINSLGRYQYGVGDCHAQVEQMEMERAWREQQPTPTTTTTAREDESSTARCVAAANYVNRANHLSASIDVLGHLFTSLLAPFHRMTQTWMQHGRLADQLDEFFIVPSYGSTASGFMIDASTHRLPCFVSVDAAEAVLQAGISRRVVRAAAAHLVEAARLSEVACRRAQQGACANDEMMEECEYDDAHHHHHQQHPSRRPCAADAYVGSWLVEEFLDALDGRRVSPFPALPCIDPVDERGTLRYWRAFHGACNTLLLSRVEAELKEARAEVVADMAKTTKQKKFGSDDVRHSVPASVSAAQTPQEDNEEAPLADANTCASEDDSHISIEVVMNDEDDDDDVGMLAPPRTSTDDDYVEIFLDGLSVAPLAENEDEDEEEEPIHSATASTASSVLGLRRVVPQRSGSNSTLSSQSSHAASALYGAIAEEMRQVAIVREDVEEASMHVKHAMQHTYTQDVRHFCWMKRMKSWKDQRMALCPLRSAAVRQTVDELRALYDAHTSTLGDDGDEEGSTQRLKFVVPFSRCPSPTPPPVELFPTLADESSKTKHVGVSFLVPKSSSSSSSRHEKDEEMMQMEEEPPCTDINRWANEVVPVAEETNATSIRGGTLPEAAQPHLAAAATTTSSPALLDEAGLPHPAECYVVDDINDEEYFQQRVGPTSHRRAEYEALMAHMAEMEVHMQTVDVHSSFYRNFCSSIARQRLGLLAKEEVGTSTCNEDEDAPQHCFGVAGLPSSVATAATRASAWDDDDPRIAERTWSSDATHNNKNTNNSTDEPATSWPRTHVLGDDELGATLTETMRLTPAAAEALQSCGAYLHIIAQHNAMYMTHKALQLALLPPHGSIFQVLQQMMNVCLLQGGGLVFGLMEMWDRRVEAALDSAASPHHHHHHHHHPVDAWATLSELNEVFGAAWSASLVGGAGRSVEVAWVLSGADARNGATLARARMLDEMGWEAEEEESMMMMMDDGGDDAHDHHVVPSNLFEFIACLTLRCQRACGGMWLLPQGVVEDVGDVCSTLLLWKTLERVVLRTWRAGMDSGMPEVFFFCNVARQTFTSLQQHTWHTISSVVKSYRASLELLSGVLYAFHALSEFTAATELFLAELRLAAILAEPLCSCWDPIYVMLRELEEVERVARFVARERRSAMLYHRNAMDAIAALAEDVVTGGGGIARSKDALAAVRLAQSLIARTAPVPLAADVAVAGVPPPLSDQEVSSMLHDSTTQHDDDDASLPPPPPRKRTGGKRRLAKSASTSTKERRSRKTKRLSPTAPTHVKVGWRGGTSATVATDRRAVVRRLRPSRSNNVASGTTTKTNTHVDATRGTTFGGAAKRRFMKGVVPRLQRETTMILEEELQRQRNVAHAAIATRLCSFGTTLERLVEYLDEARDALNAEDAVQRFFQTSTADEVERGEDADAHRGSSRMEEAKMWRQQKQAAQRASTSIASLTAQLQLTLSAIHVKTRTEGSDG